MKYSSNTWRWVNVNELTADQLKLIEDSQFMPVIHAFLEKYTQTGNSLFDSLELKI